jgi:hypothetical protein
MDFLVLDRQERCPYCQCLFLEMDHDGMDHESILVVNGIPVRFHEVCKDKFIDDVQQKR